MTTFGRRRFLGGMTAGAVGSLFPWVAKAARISPTGEMPTERIETVQVLVFGHRFKGHLSAADHEAIVGRVGRVNANPHQIHGLETILFAAANITVTTDGNTDVRYEFRIRRQGWNSVRHPLTGRPSRVRFANGGSLYATTDLERLPCGEDQWYATRFEPLIQPTRNVRAVGRRA